MHEPTTQTVFRAKSWYHYVGALVVTGLALFCAIMGPLFLFDVLQRADGRPAQEGGIALCIIAVPTGLVAMLGWFNALARRRPLLRIGNEGIEVNVIGSSSLDGVPLVPTLLRVAWLVLSLQGFRSQLGWARWEELRSVGVTGAPMMRMLTIDAVFSRFDREGTSVRLAEQIVFRDADFRDPPDRIAAAIQAFHDQPDARQALRSLCG